ncbi:hypothetical protein PVAP13_9NG066210 [Panicum virgatum]|uniref:Uncharacterized protein n=1 Tax=Panicum virgatum TaxID=38727 RepID=A0A8T0MGR8_PANVG|nr:hypothetical protein PVAP13_9NG066210 [Panicum virgatum]
MQQAAHAATPLHLLQPPPASRAAAQARAQGARRPSPQAQRLCSSAARPTRTSGRALRPRAPRALCSLAPCACFRAGAAAFRAAGCTPAGPTRPRPCTCCSLCWPAAQLRRPERKALGVPAPRLSGLLLGRTAHAHTRPRLAPAHAARLVLARAVRLLPRRRSPLRDEPAEVELGIWPVDWGM